MPKQRKSLSKNEVRASIEAAKMRLESAMASEHPQEVDQLVKQAMTGLRSLLGSKWGIGDGNGKWI